MNKEDILKASRRENKNADLALLEANRFAGSVSASVGAIVCGLVSVLASTLARTMLYSPWVIYFSIMASSWLVKGLKLKRVSDLLLGGFFSAFAVMALIALIGRLSEGPFV